MPTYREAYYDCKKVFTGKEQEQFIHSNLQETSPQGAPNGTMIGLAECLFYPPNRDHALVKLSIGGCRVSKPPEALLVVEMRYQCSNIIPWACIMAKRPWNSERVESSCFEAIVTTARL